MSEDERMAWPMPRGKVKLPTKAELATDIAKVLGLEVPRVSRGASVDSTFLDRIHTARTGDKSAARDAYRKAQRVLEDLGLTYDPFWDTSESSETGGSTVTNRAYSRIRAAVTQVPRCFLVRATPEAVGQPDRNWCYLYDSKTTGRSGLSDAGPGSRVIFYQEQPGGLRLTGHGEVTYIRPGWAGPWQVELTELTTLDARLPLSSPGWDGRLNDITEVDYNAYRSILSETGNSRLDEEVTYEPDPGGDVVAERILAEIPLPDVAPALHVPDTLPQGELEAAPATTPVYTESEDSELPGTGDLPERPRDRKKAKAAEERAVRLANQALEADGWTMRQDRQKDGVGYDLLYKKGNRDLHVEVKGITSTALAFNLTPKEDWRAATDPDFVVVAVTHVLSPTAFTLHLLTRNLLVAASRTITGYRLQL